MSTWRNSRRASGSRLATGSSRMSSSGRLARPRVSASWARWPPESRPAFWAGSRPSRSTRDRATASSQRGLRWAPSRRWSAMLRPGVRRGVLGDEADLGELGRRRRPGGRRRPRWCPAVGREQPDGQAEQGGLAGAVGADQAGDAPGGDLQGAVRQRPPAPVALAQARRPAGRRSRYLLLCVAKRAREQRLDALVVEPGQPGLGQPALAGPCAAARARPARRR